MKKCAKCGESKQLSEFYRTSRVNGYAARCKPCHGLEERKCNLCGAVFEGARKKIYCSDGCRKEARPQTFKQCENCGITFGPVDSLSRRFCKYACKVEAQKTGRKRLYISSKNARSAQGKVAHAIRMGRMYRPSECEQCSATGKIEAAHYNYDDPLKVRWLCRSCHVRWDKDEPKDNGISIAI